MESREPITAELRRECVSSVQRAEVSVLSGEPVIETTLVIDGKVFDSLCDAIDAVHAGLERENAELRERVAKLDKRDDSMHIGSATVTITPTLDWTGVARELRAIAAALGDVPRLPHFWTHDGTLHIELPKLPESISVRLPAQHDREVGSARVWQYTRDSGTCRVDVLNTGDCAGYECSEYIMHCNGCGYEFGHVLYNEDGDVWMSEPPRFCPNCGRRIEVDA